jgi:hypothetical protein
MLWPQPSLFFFLGCDWHEIRQNDFSRVGDKGCFENIRIVDVTASCFGIFSGTNAPEASDLWIDYRPENRGAIKPRPAKPID